jgi:hypothetical protein
MGGEKDRRTDWRNETTRSFFATMRTSLWIKKKEYDAEWKIITGIH